MTIDPTRLTAISHASDLGRWELVRCRPQPRLAPYVIEYQGYRELTARPVRRIESAIPAAVVIFNFGPPWRLSDGHAADRVRTYGSFIAGMYSTYAVSENTGASHCLQVNLTPVGARLIFGLPMNELSERIVDVSDVMGAGGARLEARLADARDWPERFAIVDDYVLQRIAAAEAISHTVLFAWRRLRETHGAIPIAALTDELGWSRKHLANRFQDCIGLAPKTLARILRFRRAVDRVSAAGLTCWSEFAVDAGYYDQAHLIREFRQLAGMTPVEYAHRLLSDGTGVIADTAVH